jgi:hypothetical protein
VRLSDIFIPIKGLLIIGWFLVLCVLAPMLAVIVLLVGTGYTIYEARRIKDQSNAKSNRFSGSAKRPEYPS